jgi:3-dehydroquinate synthase
MKTVKVNIKGSPYDIHVGSGLLNNAAAMLAPFVRDGRLLLVTDSLVEHHVWPSLKNNLESSGVAAEVFVLPAGEKSKSWPELERLTDWLLSHHVERSNHIVALGGGVVGDITGFAAHIVKRGCGFVQIPTTLLAQVDSSVGGKTAINARSGKNLVGAFHQPAMVLIDPAVLESLPSRELAAGLAEVIKYGLIDDADFFAWCENNIAAFLSGDPTIRSEAIIRSVTAKARIVAEDEKELTGKRALLNLGHTFGHALEAETGFSDRLLHGEAVACGMVLAFRYSERLGLCSEGTASRLASLLSIADLPVTLMQAGCDTTGKQLTEHMLHDKKMSGGTLPFLLARSIGGTFLSNDVDMNDMAAFLDEERSR